MRKYENFTLLMVLGEKIELQCTVWLYEKKNAELMCSIILTKKCNTCVDDSKTLLNFSLDNFCTFIICITLTFVTTYY